MFLRERLQAWVGRRKPGSPQNRRQARAAVLFGILTFLIGTLGLNLAIETNRPQWRDPQFFHRQQNLTRMLDWNERYAPKVKTVVVLGSSRPQMGLSPQHVQEGYGLNPPMVYNCSQTGCQPVKLRLNLERLFDAGIKPDYLLIEVLPPVLNHPGAIDRQIPVSQLSLADLRRLKPFLTDVATLQWRWLKARAEPWTTYQVDLLAHAGLAEWTSPQYREEFLWTNMIPNGWTPYTPTRFPDSVRVPLEAALQGYSNLLTNYTVNPHVDQAYREMLNESRQRHIPTALFLMPESPAFRSLYNETTHTRLHAYLMELSQEYDVPIFDASQWEDDETAYMDGHHLLGPAAERFSRRFGVECVKPWLQRCERGSGR